MQTRLSLPEPFSLMLFVYVSRTLVVSHLDFSHYMLYNYLFIGTCPAGHGVES